MYSEKVHIFEHFHFSMTKSVARHFPLLFEYEQTGEGEGRWGDVVFTKLEIISKWNGWKYYSLCILYIL